MQRRLPPLNALRVFEATARLMSAKRAAAELHVTPAAVSHQIKLLETFYQVKLFKRLNRQLLLTEAGQRYATVLHDIFNQLTEETNKLFHTESHVLNITVEPALAIYWLLPRLNKFKRKHADIELRLSATYEVSDFSKNTMDIGIRWGNGKYPGLISTFLFHNELYPVCSPALLKKYPVRKPNDLQRHVLLHEAAAIAHPDYPDWRDWVKIMHADKVNPESGLYFETGYLLIQAAIDGQGVALERDMLVKSAIKSGKLVRLFKQSIHETINGYYLVYPQNRAKDPKIIAFFDWLQSEIKSL